jgi:DNA-binding response OmpR family regulator
VRDRGIATDLAYDGAAALQKGLVYRYDVIVLDRDLPGGAQRRGGDRRSRRGFEPGRG